MRWLLLAPCLIACGGAPVLASRPPIPVAPADPVEPAAPADPLIEEEVEAPTPVLRVLKLVPDPPKAKTVTRVAAEVGAADVVDDVSIDAPGTRPKITLHEAPRVEPLGATERTSSAEASSTWDSERRGPRPSALDPAARAAYKGAYRLLQEHKPREALDAFAAFVLRYPDHPYVEQATFWRGECYVKLGDPARALEHFRGVIARFPGTPKAHEAAARVASLSGANESNATRNR